MNTTNIEQRLTLELLQFGRHLKNLRISSGFTTYRVFALETGISMRQLEKIERGRMNLTLTAITRLAKALNLLTLALFNYKRPLHPSQLVRSAFFSHTEETELPMISARIKLLREEQEMTHLDLELETGIAKTIVREYEEGKKEFDFRTLVKFSVGLQVELFDLFNYEDL